MNRRRTHPASLGVVHDSDFADDEGSTIQEIAAQWISYNADQQETKMLRDGALKRTKERRYERKRSRLRFDRRHGQPSSGQRALPNAALILVCSPFTSK